MKRLKRAGWVRFRSLPYQWRDPQTCTLYDFETAKRIQAFRDDYRVERELERRKAREAA